MIVAASLWPAAGASSAELSMGAPLGAAWGATYGFRPAYAAPFVEPARALGARFTRVTLYWSQLEPHPGVMRWDDLDAWLAQLRGPDDGILTIASASPWATRTPTWVFPSSPPRDADAYRAFVAAVVRHTAGRVRYFQDDPEPNNPFFWSGTVDEFVAQQKDFHRAVKEADPDAIVLLAGCDGDFDPSGAPQMPHRAASLAFFTKLVAEARDAYDVFDLRLYGDPYTIPARVAAIRGLIDRAGGAQPIVATEYAGPTFFEFPANRRWFAALQGPEAAATMRALHAPELPIETRMFLPDAPADAAVRLLVLERRDLVVRNLIALASGVQKTAFWDLWHDASDAASPNTMQYAALRLLARDADGALSPTPLGVAFREMTARLGDATAVTRLAGDDDVFAFVVTRSGRAPLVVAWRRAARPADDAPVGPARLPWTGAASYAATLSGDAVPLRRGDGYVEFPLGSEPVFVE